MPAVFRMIIIGLSVVLLARVIYAGLFLGSAEVPIGIKVFLISLTMLYLLACFIFLRIWWGKPSNKTSQKNGWAYWILLLSLFIAGSTLVHIGYSRFFLLTKLYVEYYSSFAPRGFGFFDEAALYHIGLSVFSLLSAYLLLYLFDFIQHCKPGIKHQP